MFLCEYSFLSTGSHRSFFSVQILGKHSRNVPASSHCSVKVRASRTFPCYKSVQNRIHHELMENMRHTNHPCVRSASQSHHCDGSTNTIGIANAQNAGKFNLQVTNNVLSVDVLLVCAVGFGNLA